MNLRDMLWILALNAGLLAVIMLAAGLLRRRQPMTGGRLRKEAEKIHTVTHEAPLGGDFCRMRTMLCVLEGDIPHEDSVAALLLSWAVRGQLTLCQTEKKKLQSFGAAQQATICFAEDKMQGSAGAEGMLLGLLQSWADEHLTLQESELYNYARQQHSDVRGRMIQFDVEGRHGLRASGEMTTEKKHRYFGFAHVQRMLYTPRGVREAGRLRGYCAWLCAQSVLSPDQWRDAVLCGCTQAVEPQQLALARAMARALIGGAEAGERVHRV